MAEIEEAEHGDTGRVREWMSRAVHASGDPVWTADGVVSERWLPVSPNGRLDGFEWKVPLAEIGVTRPVIEMHAPASEPVQPSAPASAVSEKDLAAAASMQNGQRAPSAAAKEPAVEPVIPLVHAPDDPGPDGNIEADVAAETVPQPEGQGWPGKIKDLFK
jgi:HemY protein